MSTPIEITPPNLRGIDVLLAISKSKINTPKQSLASFFTQKGVNFIKKRVLISDPALTHVKGAIACASLTKTALPKERGRFFNPTSFGGGFAKLPCENKVRRLLCLG